MKKLGKDIYNDLVDKLAHEGEEAIKYAYRLRDFTNRTYNLRDSYGSAVYLKGRLVKRSIRYLGAEMATKGRELGWTWTKGRSMPDFRGDRRYPGDEIPMTGREEVMDFFSKYKPSGKDIELVIVAAMYYGGYLEKGTGLRKKYKVISGGKPFMEYIAKKYNGTLRQFSQDRDIRIMTSIKGKSWAK